MLDNFDDASLKRAVAITPPSIKLEVSGGIENDDDIKRIAALGVDYISIGAMTKREPSICRCTNDHHIEQLTVLKQPSIDRGFI